MKPRLVVVEGGKRATMTLRLPTVIGRSVEAAVKVPSNRVSRKHCEIYDDRGRLFVRDLGSGNGTIVNGTPIRQPTPLSANDLVKVGPVTLRIFDEEDAHRSAPDGKAHVLSGTEKRAKQSSRSGPSSILSYEETKEGSFVGIGDLGDDEPPKVASGDSALDAFLNNLDTDDSR